jgi:mannosyl-3-phosphoglycerate phosphatase
LIRQVRRIVVTDLDGTLLDHHTYRWDKAAPALNRLRDLAIPVVFCSSKTAAELSWFADQMDLRGPWIVENGGGIQIPAHMLRFPPEGYAIQRGIYRLDLGLRYEEIVARLGRLRSLYGFRFRGFADMTSEEASASCGISIEEARRSLEREYDEPVLFEETNRMDEFRQKLEESGLKFLAGGRFLHVTGNNDKGAAVRELFRVFREEWGMVRSLGLGDSENDLSMLAVVDVAVIIPNPDSRSSLRSGQFPHCRTAPLPGPAGWRIAVEEWLDTANGA